MKAMIFAAGKGTRLKPFTEVMPKALVPISGIPMLELLILHLKKNNIHQIIINTHHFASQIKEFLSENKNFDCDITISDESDQLLDTGGGLMKAAWFFNDNKPFLVQNVDVLCDINIDEMLAFHNTNKAMATLGVSKRSSSRHFLFNDQMQLKGWENIQTAEKIISNNTTESLTPYAFSGIHIIEPALLNKITNKGVFSMIDIYLTLASQTKITGFKHDYKFWIDMGKPDSIEKAEQILQQIPHYII